MDVHSAIETSGPTGTDTILTDAPSSNLLHNVWGERGGGAVFGGRGVCMCVGCTLIDGFSSRPRKLSVAKLRHSLPFTVMCAPAVLHTHTAVLHT